MRLCLYITLIIALTGCATTLPPDEEKAVIPISLSAQKLAPGDCGLFIWTADAKRRFIIFSQSKSKSGVWHNEGEDMILSITQQSGNMAEEQYPTTEYVTESKIYLSLNLHNRQGIIDGTRFKTGTLKVTEPKQWERIMPVVGLSACQPA